MISASCATINSPPSGICARAVSFANASRTAVREALAKDTARAQIPDGGEFIVAQEAEIMIPAPFMRPLGSRDYGSGNVYEMRIYTYEPGQIPKVLEIGRA